jgi:hypothetical protein
VSIELRAIDAALRLWAAPSGDSEALVRKAVFFGLTWFGRLGADCRAALARPGLRKRCLQRGRRPVHAFAGPRSRESDFCSWSLPHQHHPGAPTTSGQRMGPAHACPNRRPCRRRSETWRAPQTSVARRWWRPRAQAPFADRLSSAHLVGDQATVDGAPGRSPASVGRRTRATPAPCRSGIGAHVGIGARSGIGAHSGAGVRSAAAKARTTAKPTEIHAAMHRSRAS